MVHIASEHTGRSLTGHAQFLLCYVTERSRVLADKASFHIKYKYK